MKINEIENDLSKYILNSQEMTQMVRPQFHILSLDKCMIFNGPKMGSTTTQVALTTNPAVFHIDYTDIKKSKQSEDGIKNLKKQLDYDKQSKFLHNDLLNIENVQKDWDDLCNNKIKKDVIILFRDPFKRYVSAFAQDFIKDFMFQPYKKEEIPWWQDPSVTGNNIKSNKQSHPYLIGFLMESGFSQSDIDSYLQYELINGAPKRNSNERKIFTKIMTLLFRNYFKLSMSNYRHYRTYITQHIVLFNSLGNSKSKVKFINIDKTNFGEYLSQYDERFNSNKNNDSSPVNEILEEVIISEMSHSNDVKYYINFILSYEYMAYYDLYNTYTKNILE